MSDDERDQADAQALVVAGQATDGGGSTGAVTKKVKKLVRRKKRPARVQADPSTISTEPPPQTGTVFNIWYNKWSGGDREDKYMSQTKAEGRCNIALDAGYTKADRIPGSFFCIFFARGVCPRGQDCDYLHRLPNLHDHFNPTVDCFGRDKFSDYRDDMDGVGSFRRQNRTIYVGRITVSDDIEEVVARHFAEWGPVERIRVLNSRGVAFITYTSEANTQFAKEAMANQSLDHDEILNVRWATADPNPLAQAREVRRIEEQAAEAVRAALPPEFVAELEGRRLEGGDGKNKRRRLEGGPSSSGYGLEGYEAPDEIHFAMGSNAVNAVGRRGFEQDNEAGNLEHEQKLMLEAADKEQLDGAVAGGAAPAGGILSGSTLAALTHAQISVAAPVSKPKAKAPSGPLVAYGSDSDEE